MNRRIYCLLLLVFAVGCLKTSTSQKCSVIEYGTNHMTYAGSRKLFDDACRKVLHDLSHKIDHGSGKIEYPFYGEGASSSKDDGRLLAMQVYFKTRDTEGNDYKITVIFLGGNDPVVLLEDSSPEKHRLINALNTEFASRGIEVEIY